MTGSAATGALRTNWFHILVALAEGARHGSGIARDVQDQTDGAVRLWPATLYRTLDEMASEGLIRELNEDEHPTGASARRRYYQMTPKGGAELSAAAERMAALAGTARKRLRGANS